MMSESACCAVMAASLSGIWLSVIIAFSFLTVCGVIFLFITARIVLGNVLIRKNADCWKRGCSSDAPVQTAMYNEGLEWQKEHDSRKVDVHIVNDGLNLYGEYYDFGSDKAVIIISGRTESLGYGYYFAKPYSDMGISVLTIDQRAHGNSDGRFDTVGFNESRDVIEWIKFVTTRFGVKHVVLHGICIGSACGMYAMLNPACPDCVDGLVAEGMYQKFSYSFINHIRERKKPVYPVFWLVNFLMWLYTGCSLMKGPVNYINKFDKPLLMLHSRTDMYSEPDKAQRLYDICPSSHKTLVWFDEARHSEIRPNYKDKYDGAVNAFLCGLPSCQSDKETMIQL